MSAGAVERAIRAKVAPGRRLSTPSIKPAVFEVEALEPDALVILLGEKRASTRVPWDLIEGIPAFLGRNWVKIGGGARVDADPTALSGYTNAGMPRAAASYIVAVLDTAGVVEVDPRRPARVRMSPSFR